MWKGKRKERDNDNLLPPPRSQRSRSCSPTPAEPPSATPPDSAPSASQTSTPTQIPASSSSGSANLPLSFSIPLNASLRENRARDRTQELASCFQALLTIAEKALDGLPIWGPKAAAGASAEILRIAQLKVENDGTIKDIDDEAARLLAVLSPAVGSSMAPISVSPHLQQHADAFRVEIQEHLNSLDRYVARSSATQPSGLKERMKRWIKERKEILAADAISKALPEVNRKIAASIQKFLVSGQIRVEIAVDAIQSSQANIQNEVVTIRQIQTAIQETLTAVQQTKITQEERNLLDRLLPVSSASHNAKGAARGYHENTHLQVLEGVSMWFRDPLSLPIYWISGIAGTGKTTIAHNICDILEQSLGAAFFFSQEDVDRCDPSKVLPTIVYQLAYFHPVFRKAICNVLSSNPDIARQKVEIQVQGLLFQALRPISDLNVPPTLLLLDALDECRSEINGEMEILIANLLDFIRVYPLLFRIVLTSRPDTSVCRMFEDRQGYMHPFVLHEVYVEAQNNKTPRNEAIKSFVTQEERGLLTQLNPVITALHNSKGAPRTCHEGTRVAVLQQVQAWFQDPESPSLLWLSGIAGTGKTTIAQSICEMLPSDLGASFFFSRDSAERKDPSNVLPTTAYQLAYSRPVLRPAICEMISQFPNFATKSVRVQVQELMFKVLGHDLTSDFPVTLLLFDALDECNKEENQEGGDLVPLLLRFLSMYPSRFKVVLTSRPETTIRRMLEGKNGQAHLFVLHEVDKNMVQSDIETYLRYEFAQIAAKRNLDRTWTENVRENQVRQLAVLADRLFIFAATLVKALSKSPFPARRIQSFLDDVSHSAQMMRGSLDRMYLQIVKAILPDDLDELDVKELVATFQCVVGAIVTLQQPLDFSSLKNLLSVEEDQLSAIIDPLYSVLNVDSSLQRPIQVFHLSFPDFLTDNARCTDVRFHIVPKDSHSVLSVRCLWIMNEYLEKDICRIKNPSLLNDEVQDLPQRLERFTSTELRYACSYWWAHLTYVDSLKEELMYELKRFTTERLLQWLELLSLIGQLQSALTGLPKAIEWYKRLTSLSKVEGNRQSYKENDPHSDSVSHSQLTSLDKAKIKLRNEDSAGNVANIATLLYDTNRTVQAFFRPISESALHVYESALTFMPHCLVLSQSNELRSERVEMISKRRAQWSQDIRVMDPKDEVCQVAVSPNGSLVASREGLYDGPIRLWDFASGTEIMHIETISQCLSFSLDSSKLLSFNSFSVALETWDVVSGECINTFYLYLDGNQVDIPEEQFGCIAISPTGCHVAFGLESEDLYLFGIDGTTTRLHEHVQDERAVAFSNDGLYVALGSEDNNVCIWDVRSMQCIATTQVPTSYRIRQIFISPDGLRVVVETTRSESCQAWVWNISTQELVSSFEVPYAIYRAILSVSDTTLACLLDSKTLCTYDTTSGRCVSVFKGHANTISTAVFSPGGSYIISGSEDRTIRVWDTQLSVAPSISTEPPRGYNEKIRDMAFSADGTKLISASEDETVCWWETRSGRMTFQIEREARRVGFLPDGTAVGLKWHNGLFSAIGAWDGETDKDESGIWAINVWNAETAEDITTLRGHSLSVDDAKFSPDFTRLVSGSGDCTVRIWDTATWECITIIKDYISWGWSVHFSPDGIYVVVVGSLDRTMCVCDLATGDTLAVLERHLGSIVSVRFSSDGLFVVSKYADGNEREWKADVNFPLPTSPSPLPPAFDLDDSGWLFVTIPPSHIRRRLCWVPVEWRGIVRSSGLTVALGGKAGLVNFLSILDTAS